MCKLYFRNIKISIIDKVNSSVSSLISLNQKPYNQVLSIYRLNNLKKTFIEKNFNNVYRLML